MSLYPLLLRVFFAVAAAFNLFLAFSEAAGNGLSNLGEIGRASCRERV